MSVASYTIQGGNFETGGVAARSLKTQLKKIGANPAVIRRAMIAAYEAEMNVVIHARRGSMRFEIDNGRLDVEVADEGPGISDVERALRPGFSTASSKARELGFGAGMGLPNIKNNSDEFTVESTVGHGTTLRFTIHLKPQALYGVGRHSVEIVSERCCACNQCLRACPTGAIRLFHARPQILDYLCIDCTACIAACPNGVFRIANVVDRLEPRPDAVLVVSSPLFVQYGAHVSAQQVLDELAKLGHCEVVIATGWEDALRQAVISEARGQDLPHPVISPACPAIVNLIEMRFPSLIPHLAPWESSFTAIASELGDKPQTWIVACPCQHTELTGDATNTQREYVLPAALRATLMPRFSGQHDVPSEARTVAAPASSDAKDADDSAVLRVTGLTQVVGMLECIEDGRAGDVAVVEPWACPEGCFGSPLLGEEPALARHRWVPGGTMLAGTGGQAAARVRPYTSRPGLRLDADMSKAVQKLGRIDRLTRELPGSNCGLCGAPTCSAFAEDVVLGRADAGACVRKVEPPKETP